MGKRELAATVPAAIMAIAFAAIATPAMAKDAGDDAPDRQEWTLSVSGGITAIEGQADQPFASLGVSRDLGASWIQVEGTWVGSGEARGLTIPADTWIGTLSAGTYIGNLGLDAYVMGGWRDFDPASSHTQAGVPISLDRSGGIFGVGAGVSYDIVLSDAAFLTPFAAVDYNRIDFASAIAGPGGSVIGSEQQESEGVTGRAGASLAYLFAPDGGIASLSAAFSTADNIAAVGQIGFVNQPGVNPPRFADTALQGGSWGELGGSLSFDLSRAVTLDLTAVTTVSFPFGDSTVGLAGLRFRF